MVRLVIALGCLAAICFTASAADPLDFKEYTSKDGRYKVLFPGKVETSEGKAGGEPTYTATAKPATTQAFIVSYTDLKLEVQADQAQPTLKLFAAGVKGKLVSEKEKALGKDKTPARDMVFEADKGVHVRTMLVLDAKRLYTLVFAAPTKDEVTSKDADKFFESFQLVK